ncbi:AsmA-like C-terminal region-containing protein [Paraburkholderia sp.]|uniref:YhdP family phospholipid transporter n=1 Tax=Paraburkholderia sp. TaxID=1926495 RepID=UPI002383B7AC|nr:AsmA-like C-terminal region-containing protein [Paraburkholderia sp.]MDE1183378.1 AsmA-like C-terminal region-containing protein [Paraburkholderia sp.]
MSERTDSADPHEAGQIAPARGGDHAVLRHTLRVVLAIAVVLYFIAVGLVAGLRYVVLPRIDAFRPRIEATVSSKIHAQLSIGKLAPHWTGFQPGLDISDLTIRDRNGNVALTIPHATATVSWSSLWQFAPILSTLVVDQPDVLVARASDGSLSVAGVTMATTHTGNDTFSTWLLRQQAIVLRGGTLRWRDARHDAPELALRDIRLAILNTHTDHHLALQAPPDGRVLHGPLDFRAQFKSAPMKPIGKPINWSGHAYVSTGPVDLPALAGYMDFPIETFAGRIDNAIWMDFADGKLTSAGGQLSGTNVSMRVRPTQPRLDVPVANFSWNVNAQPGDYTLQLDNLHAELGQPPLDDGTPVTRTLALTTLRGHYRMASVQHGQLISVAGDRVDLGILAEFSRALPLPRPLLNNLVKFNPRGLVSDYVIEVERAKPESGPGGAERHATGAEPIVRYRFKGNLKGISVAAQEPPPGLTPMNHPRAGIPGIENLWGTVDADENHGSVSLDTHQVALTLPGVFDDPRLTFDRLQGDADWTILPTPQGETHKAFSVNVSKLSVSNDDTAATATAQYTNPGHGRGSLDLKATVQRAQVKRIVRYLPTSISEKLRIYLGHALQGGTSHGATFEIHGDLTKFPYSRAPEAGIFHIVAPFKGGRFEPSPFPPRKMKNGTPSVWPGFDGIDGTFELSQNKLRIDASHANYKRVGLYDVKGRIDDLGNRASNFTVDGHARGPLADMLDYVNESALGGLSKHATQKLQADGTAALALKLTIPRTPKPHISVEGGLAFDHNRLSIDNVPPLSDLTGRVRFTEYTAQVERLAGQFLGGELHADGGMKKDGTYALDLNGKVAVDAARGLNLHGPAAQVLTRISGTAPYALNVRGAKGRLPEVTANSDLTGLALDFPAPFNKPVGAPMPLHFGLRPEADGVAGSTVGNVAQSAARKATTTPARNADDPTAALAGASVQRADLTFGPIAASYLLRYVPHETPTVIVGAVGVNKPAELPTEGVIAAVDLDTFDADAWRAVITQLRSQPAAARPAEHVAQAPASVTQATSALPASSASPDPAQTASAAAPRPNPAPETTASADTPLPANALTPFLPNRFAVHINTLTLLKRHWESVIVGASHADGKWQANVASNQVSGHVSWLPGATHDSPGTLQARFARVVIPSATENDLLGRAMSAPAQNMPSIDLVVNELIYRGRDIGRLEVDAHNFDEDGVPVWQLDKLDISNPAATLTATANWRTSTDFPVNPDDDIPRRTVFDFKLNIKDAGALLERAGQPRTIKYGSGTLSGKVVWRGGPTSIDYTTLNGNLAVDLHHGQILKVDPGVAKLLGVLSLQSLARFATLNFRDVIGEGLPFERVTGTAEIHNGIGRTDNFKLVTAPARAEMKGSVDLAQETQNLHVQVVPTVSAGAAVVAAAVINPLIGLGALVADLALTKSISTAFAREYAITGSWKKPHVERVKGDRGNMTGPASTVGAQ